MKSVINYALIAVMVLSGSYLTMQAPQLHKYYLRSHVGAGVVEVVKKNEAGQIAGGGTGFSVKAPSGKHYIMTNAHVCDMYKGGEVAVIQLPDGDFVSRKIVEISENTDLCLIEGVSELPAVSVARSVSLGEQITVVGHPELLPLTLTYGDIEGETITDVGIGPISDELPLSECSAPKNRILKIPQSFFGVDLGTIEYCVEEVNAYQTNAVIYPGNSGSPVVNYKGQLIGVAFAANSSDNYSMVIPLDDVKDFLSAY